jgi:PadR family transcriptional regulator, regulatory protein PadR
MAAFFVASTLREIKQMMCPGHAHCHAKARGEWPGCVSAHASPVSVLFFLGLPIVIQYVSRLKSYWQAIGDDMGDNEVWQGTLALMILKTLESMGPLHGYGIARRIEQVSGDQLIVQYGTLYPALLKLEQEGYISSDWGVSENNRRARFYKLTRAGHRQVEKESKRWERAAAVLARFVSPEESV